MFKIIIYVRLFVIVLAYFLLNFSMLCGGDLHVLGPFSMRHLCMFFLFCVAFLMRNKTKMEKTALPLYIGFLIVYVVCNLLNGEFVTQSFLQSLYSYHLPCIALAVGLPALVKDIRHIELFVWSLIALYVFDSLLSVLQYYNSGFAWLVATMINSQSEEGMGRTEMYSAAYGGVMGYSLVAGAFGFVVTNGYFLATYLPVLTYRINKYGFVNSVFSVLFLLLGGCVIFLTQQRMAFLSFVLVSCYIFWYGMGRKYRILLILIAIVVLLYYGISNIEMGRLNSDTNNDTRIKLFEDFFDFISKGYWLFGGAVEFRDTYDKAQHNTFLSAWVLGGILTFVVFVTLYFKILLGNLKTILSHKSQRFFYPFTLCFAVASVIFLLYSVTHSAGVQSGSPMFWVVYSMMCISYSLEKRNVTHQQIIINQGR